MQLYAFMAFYGSNQEDSGGISGSALDRGFMIASLLKKEQAQVQKNQSSGKDEEIKKPDRNKHAGVGEHYNYDKLNDSGYTPKETLLNNNDVVISKLVPLQNISSKGQTHRVTPLIYKSNVSGYVDKVWTDLVNSEGYKILKVRIRSLRKPCCW